jgi:hypothetical protein
MAMPLNQKINDIGFDYKSYFSDNYDKYGMKICRNIDEKIASLAADNIAIFKKYISSFFGEDARIDDIYLSLYSPKHSKKYGTSGSWYRDNCGHRLKLFICIYGDGTIPTSILKNSNTEQYNFGMRKVLCLFNLNTKNSYSNSEEIVYTTGDEAIFDTHFLHRGNYEKIRI